MGKVSKHEAIRFHGFVYRHFGNSLSSERGQTWYLYTDDRKYQKIHNAIFDSKNYARRSICLVIEDLYKLFLEVEKNFGLYEGDGPNIDPDDVEKFLIKRLPY